MKTGKATRTRALAFLFIAIASVGSANSQSKDKDNPTRLTSNEISGVIDSDSKGNHYYYSFMAGPGEVSITLTVEPGRELNRERFAQKAVSFTLFDRNAEALASKAVTTYDGGESKQAVARVEVTRRQLMVVGISIAGGSVYYGVGKYRLRINGAVEVGVRPPPIDPTALQEQYLNECLPKIGILRVKMKDGSIQRINLSQAEEISIQHEQ